MSVKVMARIWEDGPENQSERFVLLALADHANDAGECWPSIATIARKTCLSERGARKIIRRLEASGWLETEVGGGRHGCSRYIINPEPRTPLLDEKPGTTFPPEPRSPRNLSAKNPEPECRNPEPGSPEPLRTIKEPSVIDPREELLAVLSPSAADAFIEHRKHKRAKLTPRAAQLIAKKLASHPDPDSVIERSIMNGWTGVFPENTKGQVNDKPTSKSAERMQAFIAGARGAS